jgi:hypothetical protein
MPSINCKNTIGYIVSYMAAEIKRRPNAFRIGMATICLIVAFISVLESGLVNTSLIYLRMAENQAGEFDISISFDNNIIPRKFNSPTLETMAQNISLMPLINFTKIYNISNQEESIQGLTPRWLLPGKVISPLNHSLNTTCYLIFLVFALSEYNQ